MSLPLNLPPQQMQQRWKAQIDPVLSNPLLQGNLLTGINLTNGPTAVNHGLGRKLRGWLVVGVSGAATIYDSQASNQTPQLTLNLVSNVEVTVNLWVF